MASKRKLHRRIAELEADLFEARQAIFREALGTPTPRKMGITVSSPVATGFTVRCTCPPNRGDNYAGNCPIHDVQTTYTLPKMSGWHA